MSQIASLGTHCYAAWLLDRHGYRAIPGPFDWIFSDAAIVRACLEDDFAALLDRAQYLPVGDTGDVAHRTLLAGSHRASLWAHMDPRTEAGYARLCRQVEAFRTFLASREPVFLMFSEAHIFAEEAFRGVVKRLQERNAAARILGLVLRGIGPRSAATVPCRDGARLAYLHLTTTYGPEIGFAAVEDDLFVVEQIEAFLNARGRATAGAA